MAAGEEDGRVGGNGGGVADKLGEGTGLFKKRLGGFRLDEVLADFVVLGVLNGAGGDGGETAARRGDG